MIYYTVKGSGIPLVLIHGFPNDSRAWDNIVPELEQHFQLILVDLPGAGQSKHLFKEALNMDDMGNAVIEVLDYLNIPKAHFAGHSMGGYTCINIAQNHKSRVASLQFVHSGATADDIDKKKMREKSIKLMQRGDKEQKIFLKALFSNFFDITFIAKNPNIVEYYVNRGMELPGLHLAAFYQAIMNRLDTQHILQTANYPICWYAGDHDSAVKYETILKEVTIAPISKLITFYNCGHCAIEEAPEILTDKIIEFLNEYPIFE